MQILSHIPHSELSRAACLLSISLGCFSIFSASESHSHILTMLAGLQCAVTTLLKMGKASSWLTHCLWGNARNRKSSFKILVSLSSFLLGGSALQTAVCHAQVCWWKMYKKALVQPSATAIWLHVTASNPSSMLFQNRQCLHFYTTLSQTEAVCKLLLFSTCYSWLCWSPGCPECYCYFIISKVTESEVLFTGIQFLAQLPHH